MRSTLHSRGFSKSQMYYGAARSWNLRDQHMFDTLQNLLEHGGPDAKIVIWAHNSHLGNAQVRRRR